MFGKLMNRYFYGKSGQGDFEKEDLPQNRWQLFWEMLRVRFSALLRLNLMYVVVWIPAIFFIGRFLMYGYSGLVNLSDFQAHAGGRLHHRRGLSGEFRPVPGRNAVAAVFHAGVPDPLHRHHRPRHRRSVLCDPQLGPGRTRLYLVGL